MLAAALRSAYLHNLSASSRFKTPKAAITCVPLLRESLGSQFHRFRFGMASVPLIIWP